MRGIQFSNAGDAEWPSWTKLAAIGPEKIDRIYFCTGPTPEHRRFVTKDYRAGVKAHGFEYGLMYDPGWFGYSPTALAAAAESDLRLLGIPPAGQVGATELLPVRFDIEFPNRETYMPAFLTAWRKLRPSRDTTWTLEPFQGGWIRATSGLVEQINRDRNLIVSTQTFYNKMQPTDIRAAVENLTVGALLERVQCDYDGSRIRKEADGAWWMPAGWNGVIFDYDLLPNGLPS